jgi:hypothetical protein
MMADIHGSPASAAQNPQATTAGSAPVPYRGPRPPEPPLYGVGMPMSDAAGEVMNGIAPMPGIVTEAAAAHDIGAGLADAPYYPGPLSPIYVGGDGDPGGRDDVAGDVAGAVASATARWQEHQRYTFTQGDTSGDLMHFPPSALDPGAGVGNTAPVGAFYDPTREYGGEQGAPGYQGPAI